MRHPAVPGYHTPMPYPMVRSGVVVRAPGPVTAAAVLLYVYAGVGLIGAMVMAAGGALGSSASEVPIAGEYADRVVLIGFGGAALLVVLAAVDIVLGVCLSRGRRWAQVGTVGVSAVVALVSLMSPIAPLCVMAALVLVVLVLVPGTSRRHFTAR